MNAISSGRVSSEGRRLELENPDVELAPTSSPAPAWHQRLSFGRELTISEDAKLAVVIRHVGRLINGVQIDVGFNQLCRLRRVQLGAGKIWLGAGQGCAAGDQHLPIWQQRRGVIPPGRRHVSRGYIRVAGEVVKECAPKRRIRHIVGSYSCNQYISRA